MRRVAPAGVFVDGGAAGRGESSRANSGRTIAGQKWFRDSNGAAGRVAALLLAGGCVRAGLVARGLRTGVSGSAGLRNPRDHSRLRRGALGDGPARNIYRPFTTGKTDHRF